MGFAQDITKFIEKTGLKADKVIRKVAFDGLEGCMKMSPVDTGRFRGSWNVGINKINKAVAPAKEGKSSTARGVMDAGKFAEGAALISKAKFDSSTIYITNNLPYAGELERGSSKQAPSGVLKITVERLKLNLAAAVKAVENG